MKWQSTLALAAAALYILVFYWASSLISFDAIVIVIVMSSPWCDFIGHNWRGSVLGALINAAILYFILYFFLVLGGKFLASVRGHRA